MISPPFGVGQRGAPHRNPPRGDTVGGPLQHKIACARPPAGPFSVVRDCVSEIKLGLCTQVLSSFPS